MADWRSSERRAKLRLIGPYRLTDAADSPVAISSRRARALLAYLALAPERTATRERLCGLLWSDRAEPQARASLRQCLLELKNQLAMAGLHLVEPNRDHIALGVDSFECDVDDVNRAMITNDVESLTSLVGKFGADDLLDGVEIGGLFADWVKQTRARFNRSLGEHVVKKLERLEAAGEWRTARALAEAYLQRDPLDETVVAVAIRADVATGATHSARRRFQDLQASLAREFGARPGTAALEAFANIPGVAEAAPTPAPSPVAAPRAPLPASAVPIVVVAAFEAQGAAPPVSALRDEAISGLSRFRDLRVITDPRPVAAVLGDVREEAGDHYILGATVRTVREGPRLVVQLFGAPDGHAVWSSTFGLSGLEAAGAADDTVVQIVGAVLPSINADMLRRPPAPSADHAYDRYLASHGPDVKPANFEEARAAADSMETMIAANPSYAPPYLALAYLYNTDFAYTRAGASGPGERERAFRLAKTALAMDRGHVHGYTVTGWCYLRRREFATARVLFEQALDLNSFHARRVMEVGWGYLFIGDLEAAQALFDRCLLLYPSPADGFYMDLGLLALIRGDHIHASHYFDLTADPEIWVAIYSAINAVLGGLPADREIRAAQARVRSIWPPDKPLTAQAAQDWFVDHHPFQSADVGRRIGDGARRVFIDI